MIRLVADGNMSRRFVSACLRLESDFPIIHLADWLQGKHRISKDTVLLPALHKHGLILVGFDRRTMAMHAGQMTREGLGHSGVVLFRRIVSPMDYGKQSRILMKFWQEAAQWDWEDHIEYLPRTE